jgi:hypothetical protein
MELNTVAGTTADPTLHFTEVKLSGKTYKLIYDFDAVAKAEALTGLPLLVGVDWSKINAQRIRAMLYASVLVAHPEIKLSDITKLITVRNLPRIERALVDAWVSSTPDPDEEINENPPQPDPDPATEK